MRFAFDMVASKENVGRKPSTTVPTRETSCGELCTLNVPQRVTPKRAALNDAEPEYESCVIEPLSCTLGNGEGRARAPLKLNPSALVS
jgi:hypothetical protein